MNWKTREFRRRAAMGLGVLLLLPVVLNLGALLVAVPFFALYWAYVIAVFLWAEWTYAAYKKQEAPELPFGPERWRGDKRVQRSMLAYIVVFTLLREGALAPDFIINVQLYQSNSQQSYTSNNATNTQSTGGEVFFAELPTSCDISCSGDAALCIGLKGALRCDNNLPSVGANVLYIHGSVSFSSAPFCYMPLYKSGSTWYNGALTLSANTPNAGKSGSLSINGTVSQDVTGVSSCYEFDRMMGKIAGEQTAQALNQFIQAN